MQGFIYSEKFFMLTSDDSVILCSFHTACAHYEIKHALMIQAKKKTFVFCFRAVISCSIYVLEQVAQGDVTIPGSV